jgi:hypothetical protein
MNNFELYYENDEKRLEYMTRTPWLKNKLTGEIVLSGEGYPIGDNNRDPRWKGYPMSLHFNNGVMNALPLLTGPTEIYMSEGHYAMYVPKPNDYDRNVFTYASLLRERYTKYLADIRKANLSAFEKGLKELKSTKSAMNKELKQEYANLRNLEIQIERYDSANKRKLRAAARGLDVEPAGGNGKGIVKDIYNAKLTEIKNIEQNLNNVTTLIKQLNININSLR